MFSMLIVIVSTFVLSVLAVGIVLWLSKKNAWYDKVDGRKIHTGNIPRLGGVGFASAFIIVAFFITIHAAEPYFGLRFLPVSAGMIIVLVFGVIDDFRPLKPRNKLLIQCIAALCVIIPGYTFHRLFYSDLGGLSELNWLTYPISFIWIVGITNALNFIDGVDGLAGGISALISITYALIFASFANTGTATMLCAALAAAIAGFLVFNLPIPKARIFMGDGGSQFLGFILAVLPLIDKGNTSSELPLPYAAALLLIPIFDTVSAVWRRVRDGRRIDSPDKAHIHHKLMNIGLNARGVIGVLYGVQIILGVLVFLAIKSSSVMSLVFLGAAYFLAIVFFSCLHYMNRAANRRRNASAQGAGAEAGNFKQPEKEV
ncbi:MraY family glycosyltransferase [Breznakiella homolactica]|uniref:Undecaprenyl/decaprenyl-phosphate alpha-N-acetylglucosaminyl 1-phosphate transferase n=1 Tax=Breznakiella homolactica TaxID=2798577 RepID=A0A7T7XKD4_9SPIR|nr:MraY family glycosyltransferase [Breznakiella homolactica]QQO08009.1 undecaprenyl/decaprenyl-phosphate alpha-N-acetylglucosaminyl 1-phosphate transferase [Breznakiella homolactica]